ncbi:hypothetical protein QY96_02482 [Bacillus thermotolerans]|nr:hypothetical protein QY96_02482 [Bacillus thermotolerans]
MLCWERLFAPERLDRGGKSCSPLDAESSFFILLIKSSVNGQTVKKYVESPQNT